MVDNTCGGEPENVRVSGVNAFWAHKITHSLLNEYWFQNARKLLMAERKGFEPLLEVSAPKAVQQTFQPENRNYNIEGHLPCISLRNQWFASCVTLHQAVPQCGILLMASPQNLCLATIQNAPGAVHTQEFADIRI